MKLSKLYFEYIKDKHLARKGVTALILAERLVEYGFLIQVNDEYEWTEKASSRESKKEFWKVIDTTKGEPT